VTLLAAIFVADGRLYVRRRARGGLWSGLWEFPSIERNGTGPAGRIVRDLARHEGLGVVADVLPAGHVRHRLTHRDLEFDVFVAPINDVAGGRANGQARWVTSAGLGRLSVSTAHRRIYDAARPRIEGVNRTAERRRQ
jgi:A/G-specific adenine glycosylase